MTVTPMGFKAVIWQLKKRPTEPGGTKVPVTYKCEAIFNNVSPKTECEVRLKFHLVLSDIFDLLVADEYVINYSKQPQEDLIEEMIINSFHRFTSMYKSLIIGLRLPLPDEKISPNDLTSLKRRVMQFLLSDLQ